jgi:hypothetical protein
VSDKYIEEIKAHILCAVKIFFFENHAVFEVMWKKYCIAGRARDGACPLHAVYLRLHIHTPRLCNTHYFSTPTMVASTRLNVTLYVHFLHCYFHAPFSAVLLLHIARTVIFSSLSNFAYLITN